MVLFTLTEVGSPQGLPGGGAAEGKVTKTEEKWGDGACAWLTAEECLSSEDQGRSDLVWRILCIASFLCVVWTEFSAALWHVVSSFPSTIY